MNKTDLYTHDDLMAFGQSCRDWAQADPYGPMPPIPMSVCSIDTDRYRNYGIVTNENWRSYNYEEEVKINTKKHITIRWYWNLANHRWLLSRWLRRLLCPHPKTRTFKLKDGTILSIECDFCRKKLDK